MGGVSVNIVVEVAIATASPRVQNFFHNLKSAVDNALKDKTDNREALKKCEANKECADRVAKLQGMIYVLSGSP